MRIERGSLLGLAAALGILAAGGAAAAPSVVSVDARTEIATLDFRFTGTRSLSESDLRKQLVLPARSQGSWLRRAVAYLPLVPSATRLALEPLELQRNVARLRRLYHDSGFVHASIQYEIVAADRANAYDVTFVIEEGPPVLVRRIEFLAPSTGDPFVPPEPDAAAFEDVRRRIAGRTGTRHDAQQGSRLQSRLETWWRERGYASPRVEVEARVDSLADVCDFAIRIEPGAVGHFGDIAVSGQKSVDAEVIRRELPFREGDRYSARGLVEGQRQVQGLDLVRSVSVEALPESAAGGLVPVRVRVSEREGQVVTAAVGYDSDGGIAGEAGWTHRNFFGDARALDLTLVVRSGWLAIADLPERRVRAAATLRQPYLWARYLSLLAGPFFEWRDDEHDRSHELGIETTLVFELAPLRALALRYELSQRRIEEYRFGDVTSGDIDLLTLLEYYAQGILDSLGTQIDQSSLTLTGTLGALDDRANPRRGGVVRPSVQYTLPSAWNTNQYLRLDATATGYLPLSSRVGLVARLSAGRLLPFGKSLPQPGEREELAFLRLGDETFTAGGFDDVRGWDNRLLGPKFPDVRFRTVGDSLEAYAQGYVPIGGLQRATGTLELRLPFPGLGPKWGTHVFLDAGRVWTSDERYQMASYTLASDHIYWATGAGVHLSTVVGGIRFAVGYKLNPSQLDLVESTDVLTAVQEGTSLETLPARWQNRFQFNLAIGTTF